MSEQISIPEGTYFVNLSVDTKTFASGKPVYISLPVYAKPVVQNFRPFNITEQSESSADHSTDITVDEFRASYDFIDPKEVEGKERSEYQTELEKLIEEGIVSVKYLDENGEEISQTPALSGQTPDAMTVEED